MRDQALRRRAKKEFDHDEPCGCSSGIQYALCCKGSQAEYSRDGRGRVIKSISVSKRGVAALREENKRFKEVFGRAPSSRDKVFTDAYLVSDADFEQDMLNSFAMAGTRKEIAYAFSKTGLIVSESNRGLISPEDLYEWNSAVDQYLAAHDEGIDLLDNGNSPVSVQLRRIVDLLALTVIHLGSYADRSPNATRTNLSVFFQFLLIGKAHQCAKALSKGWGTHLKTETFSLLRSIYECALLIRRLNEQSTFADTLMAQAMVGRGPFVYRTKKNGETDFSKVLNVENGQQFEARNSYFECAKVASEDESAFFEIVYPYLSSNIHFDADNFISAYKHTGSFLVWETPDESTNAIFILEIYGYFLISMHGSSEMTKILKRDIMHLIGKVANCFYGLYGALNQEGRVLDEHTTLVFFTADRLFRGESLIDPSQT